MTFKSVVEQHKMTRQELEGAIKTISKYCAYVDCGECMFRKGYDNNCIHIRDDIAFDIISQEFEETYMNKVATMLGVSLYAPFKVKNLNMDIKDEYNIDDRTKFIFRQDGLYIYTTDIRCDKVLISLISEEAKAI